MKALIVNRTDRFMLGMTIVSGAIFVACVGFMLSCYRPVDDSRSELCYSNRVAVEMNKGMVLLKSELSRIPKTLESAIGSHDALQVKESSFSPAAVAQDIAYWGRRLISFKP